MSDKQVKVAKPEKLKPSPVKPTPTKPETVKPQKAHASHGFSTNCIRCSVPITEATGIVRKVCSACDLDLQTMHWNSEHILFNKVTYMPEPEGAELSASWFTANGYELKKPYPPKRRSFFRRPNEARAL